MQNEDEGGYQARQYFREISSERWDKNPGEKINVPKVEDDCKKNDYTLERSWESSVICSLLFCHARDEFS